MEIKPIYATNILVAQLDIEDDKLTTIEQYLKAQHASFMADINNDHEEYRDGNENIIFNATIEGECPEMADLVKQIKQSYVNLAYSNLEQYEETNEDSLILDARIDSCKINLMQPGYRLGCHTHYADDAFACFYFNDVQLHEGGELVLYDPRWQRNYWFAGSKLEKIRPKRGMLVIAPAFIWHEVTQYNGTDDRLTLVVNAQVYNAAEEMKHKKTDHT